MREDLDWMNCPICNRSLNPSDHDETVELEGEKIHATCLDVAERLQLGRSRREDPK